MQRINKMYNILRIANVILLLCNISFACGEIVHRPPQYQARYLQQDDTTATTGYTSPYQISNIEEDIEIIDEIEESTSPEDVVDQRQDITETTTEVTIPIQLETRNEDAIIRGIVYMDDNKNSRFDRDTEVVLPNAIAKLFTCSRGAVVGITRTNDDGIYSFTIAGSLLPTLTQGKVFLCIAQHLMHTFLVSHIVSNLLPQYAIIYNSLLQIIYFSMQSLARQ